MYRFLLFIAIYICSQTGWSDTAYMYRYKTDSDEKVIGFQVPPGSIKYGYQILNKRLKVIKDVPPPPTQEQLESIQQEKMVKQREAILLKSFASSADAERARDRKITALDVITEITKGNILRLNMEYETMASIAANAQRKAEPISDTIKENMSNIERQISEAELFIAEKEKEKQDIRDDYAGDIAKLKAIESRDVTASTKKTINK